MTEKHIKIGESRIFVSEELRNDIIPESTQIVHQYNKLINQYPELLIP